MHINLNYEIASLVFGLLIFLSHRANYTDGSRANHTFRRLAGVNLLCMVCNLLLFTVMQYESRIFFISTVLYSGRIVLSGCMVYLFSVYIDAIFTERKTLTVSLFLRRLLLGLQIAAVLSNFLTGRFYTVTAGGIERTGIYPLLLVPSAVTFLCGAVTFFASAQHRPAKQTIPVFTVLLLILLASSLQNLFFPDILLTGTAATLCLLVTLFTLEGPEREKMLLMLKEYQKDLENRVRENNAQIDQVQSSLINGLADLLGGRDESRGNHVRRSTAIVSFITEKMKNEDLSPQKQKYYDDVAKAAPLHDIDGFQDGDGRSAGGSETIRVILQDCSDSQFIQVAENMIRYHKTDYDSEESPDGYSGKNIPLEARIMAVAEAFDCYMAEEDADDMSVAKVMKRIWDEAGTKFDPDLIRYVFSCRDRITALYTGGLK